MALIRAKAEGPRTLGVDPKTGMNVYVIHGRFGAYVQLGETPEKGSKEKPKRSSLLPTMTESTVTLDEALKLLELPRELGAHPESGAADRRRPRPLRSVRQARRRLPIARSRPTICSPSISTRALALFAAPKRSGRRQAAPSASSRTIEVTDGGAALQVLEGRYGPYVTDGETNASVPKGTDPGDALARRCAGAARGARGAAPRRAPAATRRVVARDRPRDA